MLHRSRPDASGNHPNRAEVYRRKVDQLHECLNVEDTRTAAADYLRSIIGAIRLMPQ